MVMTRGRRREVDTTRHFCPNPECAYRSWVGWGNPRANGHPSGGPWRQLLCVACRRYFLETLGTLFHGKRTSAELMVRVIACLAEGLGIRGTARVFEVDPNTVLQWLVEAAEQLEAFSRHVLHDVRVQQVQLDELFALLSTVKARELSEAEAIARLERTPQWVWVAMDPESKLWLALDVGDRTLAMAQRFVHQVTQVLAPDCAPLFLTDGFREYMTALLTHYGYWVQAPRHQDKGPAPQLCYAQVVKTVRRRRLVRVSHRVVFGTREAVERIVGACGWQINTAFVERAGAAEAEMDEMWSFVGNKGNPRWLWHAIDHHTGKVLAYVFGRRKDEVFLQLKALLEPFGLTRYYTDHWGAYTRHLDPDVHSPGKRHTQKIERKHLTLRTRMKRLVRKTICFSKTTQMHDLVIGLFVNRYAFGRAV
jgi:insertion element IS1 protein InsB